MGLTEGANPEEDFQWMAGFWDQKTGDYFPSWDWGLENGGSMWSKAVQEQAKVCVIGLENMLASIQSDQNPASSGQPDAFMLQVAWCWCRRVATGNMPLGRCLRKRR